MKRLLLPFAACWLLVSGPVPALHLAAADRWEADIQKFEAQDRLSPPPANGVVFVGSSSIVRWKLADAFPDLGAAAINRGFGGSVIADAARYADRIVIPYKPRTVVLYSGDNDLVTSETPEQIAAGYRQFVEHVRAALPRARVVVISIKPSVQRWSYIGKARAANALIEKDCAGRPGVAFLNVEPLMLGADGKPRPELFVADGLHMSADGYRIWNDAIRPLLATSGQRSEQASGEHHLLYVAEPGIRNYVEYGGVGVLVYDMDAGYTFLRRIPSQQVPAGKDPENVKGIAANAKTGRLYVTTIKRIMAFDLLTDRKLWDREIEGGCDRLAVSPDGTLLYVPSLEGPTWNVLDGATGEIRATIVTNSGAHNTIYGPDGRRVYLAGLRSPILSVADPATHTVVEKVGPFSNAIRPFTINAAQTLCFVNVNDLLGFEVGDLKTGKMLHRVEVAGFNKGSVKRHGCPSHGIGLTPDEREIWLADGANNAVHIFDATVMPPRQIATVKVRDLPGWITFTLDGKYALPSTGEVIDTATRKVVTALRDEQGHDVQSEKVVEVVFAGGTVVRTGDQFGIGRRR